MTQRLKHEIYDMKYDLIATYDSIAQLHVLGFYP